MNDFIRTRINQIIFPQYININISQNYVFQT